MTINTGQIGQGIANGDKYATRFYELGNKHRTNVIRKPEFAKSRYG